MSGQLACVTGATSGIGAEFARQLALRGFNLLLTGRREDALQAQAESIRREQGVAVEVALVEFADPDAVKRLASRIAGAAPLAWLVNNAGFGQRNLFVEESADNHEAMLQVHSSALLRLTHAALPGMIAQGSGRIVNVSSIASFLPYPRNAMYSATKAFVTSLSESLHIELQGTGVQIQALCPGMTRTDFHSRLGEDASVYRDKGLRRAMSAAEVVEHSLLAFDANVPVCVPGMHNAFFRLLASKLPRRLVYRIVSGALGKPRP